MPVQTRATDVGRPMVGAQKSRVIIAMVPESNRGTTAVSIPHRLTLFSAHRFRLPTLDPLEGMPASLPHALAADLSLRLLFLVLVHWVPLLDK